MEDISAFEQKELALMSSSAEPMDTIRFTKSVHGVSPLTDATVEVKDGTEGVVIRSLDKEIYLIEVPNYDTGIPLCFVEVDHEHFMVVNS